MTKANRPLSPHLQVYNLPLTARMSISFRIMGVGLAIGFVLLAAWLIAAGAGRNSFDVMQAFLTSWFGQLLLLGWTVAFFYHACNGVRHMIWDTGRGIDNDSAARSGKLVLAAAAVLTVLTWAIALTVN